MDQTATEIRQAMAGLGVHLRQDWIKHCCLQAGRSNGGNGSGGRRQAQEDVYRTFLACDLREAGEACLPAGVGDMVKGRVKGKMVVQVENARDIAKSFEQRENADGGSFHHTLKLALGDGRQTVAAFEYRRIQGLAADPPPGLKLLLVEPWVRRGILLLSSENTTVLGGEVSSLVEARDAVRVGGGDNSGATRTTTTTPGSAGERQQNRQPAAQRAAGSGNRSKTDAVARERNATSSHHTTSSSGRPRRPPPSPPGRGSSNSQAADRRRRRDHDENSDPATAAAGVVDLSSSSEGNTTVVAAPSSSRGRRTGNGNFPAPRHQGGGRPTAQPGRVSGVVNPYAAVTQPGPSLGAAARTPASGGGGASNSNSSLFSAPTQASQNLGAASGREASRSGETGGRQRRGEARVPAFQDMDDDDGPEFEYLEEPDFDDDDEEGHRGADIEQEPPDEAPTGRGGSRPGEAASRDRDGRNRGTGKGAVQTSPQPPPPPPLPATPRHRPRPKIVSARARLREQEERGGEEQGRRRAREDGGGGGVVDIEGDFRGGGTSAEKSGGGLEFPRRKRGRSNNQLGDGEGELELERGDEPLSSPPSGPYTALEDLDRLTAAGGGVFRAKAVVSDTMGCKIRKKKYLLAVEIEDGTTVVRVRLSEQITRRLFGVEAREFKKIYQRNEDQASRIQARVEREIKQMEGVMEIDTFAAASASQQSTPGTATSQSPATATGDPEWLLPVVVSVSPPTDADCRELLSRVSS